MQKKPEQQQTKPTIFVLMPINRELDNVFYAIREAASAIGANAERADRPLTAEIISQRIYTEIENADLVLADLTYKNPNVIYEVGYAHALGKPAAFLAPDINDIPFDLRMYPILAYSASSPVSELVGQFKPYLKSMLYNAIDTASLRAPVVSVLRHLTQSTQTSRLFKAILVTKLRSFASEISQWLGGTLRVGPEETREKGIEILKHLNTGGFATFLVPTQSYWITATDYFEAARHASWDLGKKITRVYIVFDESSVETMSLKECIFKDNEAGIETLICFANKLTDREAIRDFGIWDDEILSIVEVSSIHGSQSVIGCSFTVHQDLIVRAYRWKDNIMSVAEPAKVVLARYAREEPLHQPLVTSAGIMEKYADQFCKGSYLNNGDCRWYHGNWEYLRLVNVVSTPDWHSEFYRNSITNALINMSPKRILISGTADYCILAHVFAALPENLVKDYEIVVLDLCVTPIKICEWFADQHLHIGIRTFQGSALQTDFRDNWFGLVITDAFLTRFDSKARKQVVAEWARILAPGGFVVTTVRVEQNTNREKIVANERDVQTFIHRTRTAGFKQAYLLPCTVEQLAEIAEEYARRIVSYPLLETQLPEIFSAFELKVEVAETPGEFKPTTYARVIAKKR